MWFSHSDNNYRTRCASFGNPSNYQNLLLFYIAKNCLFKVWTKINVPLTSNKVSRKETGSPTTTSDWVIVSLLMNCCTWSTSAPRRRSKRVQMLSRIVGIAKEDCAHKCRQSGWHFILWKMKKMLKCIGAGRVWGYEEIWDAFGMGGCNWEGHKHSTTVVVWHRSVSWANCHFWRTLTVKPPKCSCTNSIIAYTHMWHMTSCFVWSKCAHKGSN